MLRPFLLRKPAADLQVSYQPVALREGFFSYLFQTQQFDGFSHQKSSQTPDPPAVEIWNFQVVEVIIKS